MKRLVLSCLLTAAPLAGAAAQPTGPAAPAPAPPAPELSIAPADEPGWRTVLVPGGYYRYRPDASEDGAAPDAGGSVTLVPAPPRAGESASDAARPEQTPAGPRRDARPDPRAESEERDPCRTEREALARRLVYLRGLGDVDGPTADLLLRSEAVPFGPHLQRSMFGLPSLQWGSPSLLSAAQFDTPARGLAEGFARCLGR